MPGALRLVCFLILSITALAACTKTVRVVAPLDYGTALTDTTRIFEIHTRDGSVFVSKKAVVEGDTLLVVARGYQIQTDEWKQKKLAKVPIHIPMNSISQISQIEIAHDRSLAVVLVVLAIVLGIAFISAAAGLGGGS